MVLETRELQFKNLLSPSDGFNEPPSPTLSLLPPSQSGSSKLEPVNVPRPKKQLTIFYAGSVNVFDNISEDKANAIMLLAGNSVNGNVGHLLSCLEQQLGASASNPVAFPEPAQKIRKIQAMASPGQTNLLLGLARPAAGAGLAIPHVACSPVAAQGLPQARKASLTRFLQRRKESSISRAMQQKLESDNEKSPIDSAGKNPECSLPPEEHSALKMDTGVQA